MNTLQTSDLKAKLASQTASFFLIDVRETEEFEAGHIQGALLMPWHIVAEKVKGIRADKEFILYCNTGVRALKAAKSLEDIGFKNLLVYVGGWEEWDQS